MSREKKQQFQEEIQEAEEEDSIEQGGLKHMDLISQQKLQKVTQSVQKLKGL